MDTKEKIDLEIKKHNNLKEDIKLQDPPEYFIEGATSIPIIRNKDIPKQNV